MADGAMAWNLGVEDAAAIADFLTQLGYPTTPAQAAARIQRFAPGSFTMVGERHEGRLVAFAAGKLDWTLQRDEPVGRIIALAVHPDHQRSGLGALLVRRLEGWARDKGVSQITVDSGSQRRGAHRFYLARGYDETGARFGRSL